MKKKTSSKDAPTLFHLNKKWEKIWSNLNEVNIYFQSYIDTTLYVQQRIKMEPLIKSFEGLKDHCQQFYDLLDETVQASKRVEVVAIALPWDTDKFKEEWGSWKEYLKEQHQIELSSRAERKQLDTLLKITSGVEENAYPVLDYAQANLYKMFFKLDEKQPKTKAKTKHIRKDEDF